MLAGAIVQVGHRLHSAELSSRPWPAPTARRGAAIIRHQRAEINALSHAACGHEAGPLRAAITPREAEQGAPLRRRALINLRWRMMLERMGMMNSPSGFGQWLF